MKKTLKILLICLLAVMCSLCVVACGEQQTGTVVPDTNEDEALVDYEGTYQKPHNTAYGEEPDLDNVIIDGFFDDDIWQNKNWYTNYKIENPNFKFSVTTHLTDGGLYIAAKSDDTFLFWNGRNYFFYNTYMKFDFASTGYSFKVDVNNTPPSYISIINVRSRYEGTLNAFGEGKGMYVEAYLTWEQLGYGSKPESVKILPSYYWTIKPNTTNNLLASAFVTGSGNANQYVEFDTNGYVDADNEKATIGSHSYGLAKTNGWKVNNPGEENETTDSLTGSGYNGYIRATYFRNIYSNRFMLKTRITVNSNSGTTRAGLLMYVDNIKYRAFSVELNDELFKNDTILTLPMRAYTNYPSNITVTTKIADIQPDKGNGREANQFDLTVFANNGMMYYLVNDKFVYSESATYIQSAFAGFYAYNSDVTFSNYEAKEFNNEEEIKNEISKYVYTVDVKNKNSQAVKGELSQIATSNTGDGSIDVNLIFGIGKELKDNQYQRYNLTDLYYEVVGTTDENLKHVDLMDEYKKGSAGKFTIHNVPGNIIVHVEGERVEVATDSLVTLTLKLFSPQMQTSVTGVNISLYGSGPAERYDVTLNKKTGILEVKVPKGYTWSFVATKTGYRSVSGTLFGGEVLNEQQEPETFNMLSAVVGGTAVAADDARYNSETGEYETLSGFSRASTPSIYWDLSEEENNKVTFTSTNTGSSNIYFSGKTAAEYQVAYVELTNQTDYMAFQSIEDDPGVGFTIATNSGNTFCGLRQTGVRIVPASGWANVIGVGGLCGWQGGIASIDRNNNGRVLGVSMGTGSVNRVPIDGKTFTTSFLIIRRGGNIYLYAADGRAGVKSDGTNFDKMQLFYKGYIADATGVAALGFAITVSYNLRVDFENYWILAGQSQAGAFADKIITTDLSVEGEKDLIKLTSDGLSNYDAEKGTGKIALSSEVTVTAAGDLPEGKIIKLTLGDSVTYLNSNTAKGTLTVSSIDKPIVIKAESVEATKITGDISVPGDEEVSLAQRAGKILDANGNTLSAFTTAGDGSYSLLVEKGATLYVSINIDGYAANKIEFVATGAEQRLSEMQFEKLIVGGKVGSFTTNSGMLYGKDDAYHGAYAQWVTSSQGDATLTINSDYNNKEDFVLSFSYVRSSAATNNMPSNVKDESDLGLGIIASGDDASNIQFLNIGTGYRMLHNTWAGRHEQRGMGRVNFAATDIPLSNYAQVKIIKKGGVFYLLSKYANDEKYTMSVAFPAVNDNGTSILSGAVTFAIKMTVTSGKYLNLTFFDIKVEEVNKDTAPEIVANVTLEQPEEGSIAVEGQNGNNFEIAGAASVNVTVTPPEEKKVAAIYVNGVAQSLGNYTEGVFTGAINVSGDSTISVEFKFKTYEKTETIKMKQKSAQSVVLTNGTTTIVLKVSLLKSDLGETVAVIDEDSRTVTFMAPKGTWTVTLCSDTEGKEAIGSSITSVVA